MNKAKARPWQHCFWGAMIITDYRHLSDHGRHGTALILKLFEYFVLFWGVMSLKLPLQRTYDPGYAAMMGTKPKRRKKAA